MSKRLIFQYFQKCMNTFYINKNDGMPLNASGLMTVIPFSVHFVTYKIDYSESYQNIFNTAEYGRILILSCAFVI